MRFAYGVAFVFVRIHTSMWFFTVIESTRKPCNTVVSNVLGKNGLENHNIDAYIYKNIFHRNVRVQFTAARRRGPGSRRMKVTRKIEEFIEKHLATVDLQGDTRRFVRLSKLIYCFFSFWHSWQNYFYWWKCVENQITRKRFAVSQNWLGASVYFSWNTKTTISLLFGHWVKTTWTCVKFHN